MPPQIPSSTAIAQVLDRLACPACYGELKLEPTLLVCSACGRAYPLVDGIPVLIADRTEQ